MQKELSGSHISMKKIIAPLLSGLLLVLTFIGLGETQNVIGPPLAPPAKASKYTEKQIKILDEIALLPNQLVEGKKNFITLLEVQSKPVIGTGIEFLTLGDKIIYVDSVAKGSPGDQVGVKRFDVFVSLNGKDIPTLEMLEEELEGKEKQLGRKSALTLLRGRKVIIVPIVTALLREDRTAQVRVLIEKVEKEFSAILQKISGALDELRKEIEAGIIKVDDQAAFEKHPLVQKVSLALKEFYEWGNEKSKEAKIVLEELPVQH